MLYWNEIINDLAKYYLRGFVVHVLKFIWRSYKCSMCQPFVTRHQYDSLILPKQTWAYTTVAAILPFWYHGRWSGADVTKECLEKNFPLSSTLLRKLCVHYVNGFDTT